MNPKRVRFDQFEEPILIKSESQETVLKSEFLLIITCQLCKGLYREAHTINECLCTFCKKCIFSFYSKNNLADKCPQCHTNLGGYPQSCILPDQKVQILVDLIYPNFKEADLDLKKKLIRENKERLLSESKLKLEAKSELKKEYSPQEQLYKGRKHESAFTSVAMPKVQMYLKPIGKATSLKTLNSPAVQTPASNTIYSLKKFLSSKTEIDIKLIEILCLNQKMDDSRKIGEVRMAYWTPSKLELAGKSQDEIFSLEYMVREIDDEMNDE